MACQRPLASNKLLYNCSAISSDNGQEGLAKHEFPLVSANLSDRCCPMTIFLQLRPEQHFVISSAVSEGRPSKRLANLQSLWLLRWYL